LSNVAGQCIRKVNSKRRYSPGEKENLPSCVHVPHKNFNLVISRYSCAQNDKEMYQQV